MKTIVFCDVDGTLINRQLQDYLFYIRRNYDQNQVSYFLWGMIFFLKAPLMLFIDHFVDRRLANKLFYQGYRGISLDWYKNFIPRMVNDFAKSSMNNNVLKYLESFDFKQTDLYLISGNDVEMIKNLPLNLPVKEAIGSELLNDGARLNGKIKASQVGLNKKKLVEKIIKNYPKETSIVVLTDHHSDLPLLELAHIKIAVNPSAKLRAIAQKSHWQIIE